MRTLVLLLCAASVSAVAPASAADQWAETIDAAPGNEALSIQTTKDGGYIVSGAVSQPEASYRRDFWVAKLAATGAVEWQKVYGSPCGYESAKSARPTRDGGYVVVGDTCFGAQGGTEVWVLKLDWAGNIVWQSAYGGPNDDRAYALALDVAPFARQPGFVVAGSTLSSSGDRDALLLKLRANGTVEWAKTYGEAGNEEIYEVEPTSDQGYILVGSQETARRGRDVWVLRLDRSGAIVWQARYGGADVDSGTSIRETLDAEGTADGYILAGASRSFDPDARLNAWVLRLHLDGSIAWQTRYVPGIDYAGNTLGSVQQLFDQNGNPDGYIGAGNLATVEAGHPSNLWFLRIDPAGSILWQSQYGGYNQTGSPLHELAQSVCQSADGGFVAAGYAHDLTLPSAPTDAFIVKVSEDGALPLCSLVDKSDVSATATGVIPVATNAVATAFAMSATMTSVVPRDIAAEPQLTCSSDGAFLPSIEGAP
jgi:hypothetical protein